MGEVRDLTDHIIRIARAIQDNDPIGVQSGCKELVDQLNAAAREAYARGYEDATNDAMADMTLELDPLIQQRKELPENEEYTVQANLLGRAIRTMEKQRERLRQKKHVCRGQ